MVKKKKLLKQISNLMLKAPILYYNKRKNKKILRRRLLYWYHWLFLVQVKVCSLAFSRRISKKISSLWSLATKWDEAWWINTLANSRKHRSTKLTKKPLNHIKRLTRRNSLWPSLKPKVNIFHIIEASKAQRVIVFIDKNHPTNAIP